MNQRAEQAPEGRAFTVTGSLIERTALVTPAPLTILSRDDLDASGRATLGDILQQLPAQASGINAQVNLGGDGSTRFDFRGLGSNRTLVLLNGRRLASSGLVADTSIDLNSIPLAVIDRVEILKDGASAIYGSDAIGGVVNIITRADFDGAEASLYTADTQRGGGFTYDASVVTGYQSKNKKANILFSAGIQRQDPVFVEDRSFSRNFFTLNLNGTVYSSPVHPGNSIDAFSIDRDGDGKGDGSDLCGAGVQYCTNNGSGGYRPILSSDRIGDQHTTYLYTPSSRFNVFTTGSYEHGGITGFFEASYLHRTSAQQRAPETFFTAPAGVPVSKDSLYNSLGGDVLTYGRQLDELGPRRSQQDIDTFRTVAGTRGTIAKDAPVLKGWVWESSYTFALNTATGQSSGNLILSRLKDAIGPSFLGPAGPTCGTPVAPIPGCVPIDILGPSGSIDPSARDYIEFAGTSSELDVQQTWLATTHGQIAQLPNNGDLSAAVGADVRRDSGRFTPDPVVAPADTTTDVQPLAKGSSTALEGFGELSWVPFRRRPYAEWLELDLAARALHYDSFGNGIVWNAGGLFRPFHSLAIRGTYATTFRAPSISELYQRKVANDSTAEAESGRTITAGIVLEPPLAPGLTLTVDYWSTRTTKAIEPTSENGSTVCYDAGLQKFCDTIRSIPVLSSLFDHDVKLATSGIDMSVIYDHPIGGLGSWHEQFEGQYLFNYDLDYAGDLTQGRGNHRLGVHPWLKASLSSVWRHPSGASAGINVHYIGSFQDCDRLSYRFCSDAGDWYKIDLFGSYTLKSAIGRMTLSAGVNNVLDRDPLTSTEPTGGSDPSTYDYLGRLFYARLSQRF